MYPALWIFIAWLFIYTPETLLAQDLPTRSASSFVDPRESLPTPPQRAGGNDCPQAVIVGDLPDGAFTDSGDTCDPPFANTITSYGGSCTLQGVQYPGPDAVYEIVLTAGNNVEFSLDLAGSSGDLMLALVSECGDGASCLINSVDFIGGGISESIPAANYPPGVYFLYIDSFYPGGHPESCGQYSLSVTGSNPPRPDLAISLSDSPDPVPAGGQLTYTLTVTNDSPFRATGVEVINTLPADVELDSASGCTPIPMGRVRCNLGTLAAFASTSRQITVTVNASAIGVLTNTATVHANETDLDLSNNQDDETTPIGRVTDLVIVNNDSRDPVAAGENLTYNLTVTNNGPSEASNISINNTLPAEVGFVSASSGCSHSAGEISCTLPDLAPGTSTTRTITVSLAATLDPSVIPSLTNSAAVIGDEYDPDTSNNADSEVTSVVRRTDLWISKAAASDRVIAGRSLDYLLTVGNNGPSDSTGGMVSDILPQDLSFLSSSDGCTVASGPVTCLFGAIPSGDSVNLAFTAEVDASATELISNTAMVTANEEDPNLSNNTSEPEVTAVDVVSDLSITMSDAPDPVTAGGNLTYTLVVANLGPSDSTGGTVNDTLAEGLSLSSSSSGCTEVEGTVSCSFGAIASGDNVSLELEATVAPTVTEPLSNIATVIGHEADPDDSNNSSEETTDVGTSADLRLTMTDHPDPVAAGGTLTYSLRVYNNGPSAATDVTVENHLPDEVEFHPAPGCEETDHGPLTCSLGTLAANDSTPLSIMVTVDADIDDVITNTANVSSETPEDNPGDETASVDTTVVPQGSIVVRKLTLPAGDDQAFTFSGDVSGEIQDNQTLVARDLVAGTYTATEEDIPEGWRLTEISCDDENSTFNLGSATATFELETNEVVTCTFTNTKDGTITIIKDAVPNDPQDFNFSSDLGGFVLDDDEDATFTNRRIFATIEPGSYTFTETSLPDWDLTAISCQDPDQGTVVDTVSATATVDMDPGEDITCTFTNTKRGTITICKDAVPDDSQDFDFTGDLGGFVLDDDSDALTPRCQSFTPDPGTYVVREEPIPSGWDLTEINCDDPDDSTTTDVTTATATIDFDENEALTCTFTNTKRGTITIAKDATPDDPQDFEFGGSGNIGTFFLDNDGDDTNELPSQQTFALMPDTYTVTEENLPEGWSLTSIDCDPTANTMVSGSAVTIELGAAEDVTCTFNNLQLGTITIENLTDPSGGSGFVFSEDIDDTIFVLVDGESMTFSDINPGSYTITETDLPPEWSLTSIDCDPTANTTVLGNAVTIDLEAGDLVTCTFNNSLRGTIMIGKVTDPLGVVGFSFEDNIEGSVGSFTLAGGEFKPFEAIRPGNYMVTETDLPLGWILERIECDDTNSTTSGATANIALDAGEEVTCIFHNIQASITIRKLTDTQSGTGFTFTSDIEDPAEIFVLDHDESKAFANVEPDFYTVTETLPPGWNLDHIECSGANTTMMGSTVNIDLTAGGHVICTFHNVTSVGRINIDKVTNPPTSPDGPVFTFEDNIESSGNFTLGDGESKTFPALDPDTYTIDEIGLPQGWNLTDIVCDPTAGTTISDTRVTIDLEAGDTVRCTFTNTQNGSIVIEKRTDQPGDVSFSFTEDIGDPGSFMLNEGDSVCFDEVVPGTYQVSETELPLGWNLASIECNDPSGGTDTSGFTANIDLAAGETVTCTFNNTKNSIVIRKVTDPPGGSDFPFTAEIADPPIFFSLSDGGIETFAPVAPGTYNVAESDIQGWSLTDIDCTDPTGDTMRMGNAAIIRLAEQEAVTCVFHNTNNAEQSAPPICNSGALEALSAWWPFDELSPFSTADIAGANNGRLVHRPTPVTGIADQALAFDGTNYLEAPHHYSLQYELANFSIDLWIKTTLQNPSTAVLIDKRTLLGDPGSSRGYMLYVSSGELHLQLNDITFTSGLSLPDSDWHHIAVTIAPNDPTGGRWYLDGVESGSFDPTVVTEPLANQAPLRIGRNSFDDPALPDPGAHFQGALDELHIFDRALTADEVRGIFEAGSAGMCKETLYVPPAIPICNGADAGTGDFAICNHSTREHNYRITFTGVPAAECGADVDGPASFELLSPQVQPIQVAPRSCRPVRFSLARPDDMGSDGTRACYRAQVTNEATGFIAAEDAILWDSRDWCAAPEGEVPVGLLEGEQRVVTFEVTNPGETSSSLQYEIEAVIGEADPDGPSLSLRSPGATESEQRLSVFGELLIPAGETAQISAEAKLSDARLLGFQDLVLRQSGAPSKILGSTGVRSLASRSDTLQLLDGRFLVQVAWRDFADTAGSAQVVPTGSDDSGVFWFFTPGNWEMLIKVLDRCSVNGHFWVLTAGTTDVEYTVTVTDTLTGDTQTYVNPRGQAAAAVTDVTAFSSCADPEASSEQSSTFDASSHEPVSSTTGAGEPEPDGCIPTATDLCLGDGRFRLNLEWQTGQGSPEPGHVVPVSSDESGLLRSPDDDNREMLIKVLDGCGINDRFWIFGAATTDVGYTLRVTDTTTGFFKEYSNPPGNAAGAITDRDAFATCP